MAGKVTVGLASHWPCVTDISGLSTYGLTAIEREMSTPPTLYKIMEYGPLYLYLFERIHAATSSMQTEVAVTQTVNIIFAYRRVGVQMWTKTEHRVDGTPKLAR